jgi:hypothetical protein
MSTTTGQGAKNRKTTLEAMYGMLAEPKEVRKHLAILGRHRNAVATLAVYVQFAAKKMPGFDESRIADQKRKLSRLEGLLLASFLKVSRSSTTLESLAAIAKMYETPGGFQSRYRVERELLAFYKAGQKSQPMLLALAKNINPSFTESDMSEWKSRYGITDLKKGKAGRPAKHAKPTHAERVEALRIQSLSTVSFTAKQAKKELRRVQEQFIEQRDSEGEAKLETLEKSWPARVAQIEREFEKHRASKAGRSKP